MLDIMIRLTNKNRKIIIVLKIHGCFMSIVILKFLDELVLIIVIGRIRINIIQFSLGLCFNFLRRLVRNNKRMSRPLI